MAKFYNTTKSVSLLVCFEGKNRRVMVDEKKCVIDKKNKSFTYKALYKADNGKLLYSLYTLKVFEAEFVVRFNHVVKDSVEIEVPKVVRNEKKWWQFNEPDTKVIVEKQRTEPKEYWLLASFSY